MGQVFFELQLNFLARLRSEPFREDNDCLNKGNLLLESRMMKGIIYDQTSLPDLFKNAADPQGRHDHHL